MLLFQIMWQEILKETVQSAGATPDKIVTRIWQDCKCSVLPGTGVRELIAATLSDDSLPIEIRWTMYSLASRHDLRIPQVINFITQQISTKPHIYDAWARVCDNMLILEQIPDIGRHFSCFWRLQELQDQVHILHHLSKGVPGTSNLSLSDDMLDEIISFSYHLYHCNVGVRTKIELVTFLSRLFDKIPNVRIHHIESKLLTVLSLTRDYIKQCKVSLGALQAFRSTVKLIAKLTEATSSSPKVYKSVLTEIYNIVLESTIPIHRNLFDALETLTPTFDFLPVEALTIRATKSEVGYENSIALLKRAAYRRELCSEIISLWKWTDLLDVHCDFAFREFLLSHGHKIPNLFEGCIETFIQTRRESALSILQSFPFSKITNVSLFFQCEDVILQEPKLEQSFRLNCAIMIIGKLIRIYNDNEQDGEFYEATFVRVFQEICGRKDIDLIPTFISGLAIVESEEANIHRTVLSIIYHLITENTYLITLLRHNLNNYAKEHPKLYLQFILEPLAKKGLADEITELCPYIPNNKLHVWRDVEQCVVRTLLLDLRVTQNPVNLFKVSEAFSNASAKTKFNIFRSVLSQVSNTLSRRHLFSTELPARFFNYIKLLRIFAPTKSLLQSNKYLIVKIDSLAKQEAPSRPTLAISLIWLLRQFSQAWHSSFLVAFLSKLTWPTSNLHIKLAVESLWWSSYLGKFDGVLQLTLTSLSVRVRDLSFDLTFEMPTCIRNHITEQIRISATYGNIDTIQLCRNVYVGISNNVHTSLLEALRRHFSIADLTHQSSILCFMVDVIYHSHKGLTIKYASSLIKWAFTTAQVTNPELHGLFADLCSELLQFLYKVDRKKHNLSIRTLDTIVPENTYLLRRKRKYQDINQDLNQDLNQDITVVKRVNLFSHLLPEVQSMIKEYLILP